MKVNVSGVGIISSIGMNLQENLNSLQNLKSGISNINLINNLTNPFLGGEIKLKNEELSSIAFNKTKQEILPRSLLLSLIAAKEAWGKNTTNSKIKTAIIGATTIGGMDLTEEYFSKNENL